MLKEIIKEARVKAEQVKNEVVADLVKSKTLNQIVSNKNFLKAVSYAIETKQEIQTTITKQVKDLLKTLNVPHKKELQELGKKLEAMEKAVERFAANKIQVKTLGGGKKRAAKTPKKTGKRKKS